MVVQFVNPTVALLFITAVATAALFAAFTPIHISVTLGRSEKKTRRLSRLTDHRERRLC